MRHRFQVLEECRNRQDEVVFSADTREECVAYIEEFPLDRLGTVVMYIREIWTNAR